MSNSYYYTIAGYISTQSILMHNISAIKLKPCMVLWFEIIDVIILIPLTNVKHLNKSEMPFNARLCGYCQAQYFTT